MTLDPIIRHYLATHTRDEVRDDHVNVALEYAKGNVSAAAKGLGMHRRSVYAATTKKRIHELRRAR